MIGSSSTYQAAVGGNKMKGKGKPKMGKGKAKPVMHGQQPMADVALGPYGRKTKGGKK